MEFEIDNIEHKMFFSHDPNSFVRIPRHIINRISSGQILIRGLLKLERYGNIEQRWNKLSKEIQTKMKPYIFPDAIKFGNARMYNLFFTGEIDWCQFIYIKIKDINNAVAIFKKIRMIEYEGLDRFVINHIEILNKKSIREVMYIDGIISLDIIHYAISNFAGQKYSPSKTGLKKESIDDLLVKYAKRIMSDNDCREISNQYIRDNVS